MNLPVHFQRFLSDIEPTPNQKAEAAAGYLNLRSRLQEEDYAAYFDHSFVCGSYGRDVALQTTKTIDVVVVANYTASLWEPHLALSHLKRILSKNRQTVTVQNSSIHIPLDTLELKIVPAIRTEDGFLKIPDKTLHNWVRSNARRHNQVSAAMDASKKGLYKPLVRALKYWRDYKMAEAWSTKSFLFECLIYDYAANSDFDSVAQGVEGFLWYTHSKYSPFRESHDCSPFIREIGATDVNVAKNWAYPEFCSFMDEVYKSWILSRQALDAQSKIMSVDRWRQLFGDAFPSSV